MGSSTMTRGMITATRFVSGSSRYVTPLIAGKIGDAQGRTHLEFGDVQRDMAGDVERKSLDVHRRADRLHDAGVALHADRKTGVLDRHLGMDLLIEGDADEVEVRDVAAHRMALHLAGDGEDRLLAASDFEVDQGV